MWRRGANVEEAEMVREKMWAWCKHRGFVFPPNQKRPTKRRRPPTIFLWLALKREWWRHKDREQEVRTILCMRGNSVSQKEDTQSKFMLLRVFPSFFLCLWRHNKSQQKLTEKKSVPFLFPCLQRHFLTVVFALTINNRNQSFKCYSASLTPPPQQSIQLCYLRPSHHFDVSYPYC